MKTLILTTCVLLLACCSCDGSRKGTTQGNGGADTDSVRPFAVEGKYMDKGVATYQVRGDTAAARKAIGKEPDGKTANIEKVGDGVYSQKELKEILDKISERLRTTADHALLSNIMGFGVGLRSVRIDFIVNTPEWRERFRKNILDSPALEFSGQDGAVPLDRTADDDVIGVFISPVKHTVPYGTDTVRFVLHNLSGAQIDYGERYFVAYERGGKWFYLPMNSFFHDIGISLPPNRTDTLTARLLPEINHNKPGRYRYYKEIRMDGHKKLLMAEFELSR